MGRHRKRHRPSSRPRRRISRRTSRRIALLTAGLLVPGTGGVVYAATTQPERPAARSTDHSDAPRKQLGSTSPGLRPQTARPTTSASASPSASQTKPAASGHKVPFAPYADVLSWPALDLAKIAKEAHVKDFTLGFVASGGGCSAAWGGLSAIDDPAARRPIKEVPGKVIVSLGGPRAVDLAQSCGTVDDLAKQYHKVIDTTHADELDFYLTDVDLADPAAVNRRTQAVARLQHDIPGLPVSYSLPLHRTGLPDGALAALRSAASGGANVSVVNVVPVAGVGSALIDAATTAHGQLQRIYHGSDAALWQRMGITPVVGVAAGVQFGPPDAQGVRDWASAHGLGRLSMWSITRDEPCTLTTSITNGTCSGLDEDPGVFTKIFEGL